MWNQFGPIYGGVCTGWQRTKLDDVRDENVCTSVTVKHANDIDG
jgi:hypothetical protein